MHYQHLTTILILTGVWNRGRSTTGNNGGGEAKPCAAPRLCMYWNISAILWWSPSRATRFASRSAIILASISSSWVYNITSQRYSNSKRRYITQVRTSYRSTNLELLYAMLWAIMPRSYGWTRARAPCSHLRQSGSGGRVDCPVGNPVPPMSLASFDPHEHIGGRSARCSDHILGHEPHAPWRCSHEGSCRRWGWCRPRARHPGCRWRRTSPCPYGP
jgi:hypothetical protein